MCGIAGILSSDIDLRGERLLVEKMGKTLNKRGPDSAGLYLTPQVAMIHRRLAVIDVENGAQPMHFGKYVIVYNGEIYNTEEIRNELMNFGYRFDTHCDTEVVLKAYDKWGEESVKKLNGIFAYAIYDKKENSYLYFKYPYRSSLWNDSNQIEAPKEIRKIVEDNIVKKGKYSLYWKTVDEKLVSLSYVKHGIVDTVPIEVYSIYK